MYFVTKDFCQHYLSSHGQKKLLIIRIEKARRSKLTFLIRNWFIKIGRLGRFLKEEERKRDSLLWLSWAKEEESDLESKVDKFPGN